MVLEINLETLAEKAAELLTERHGSSLAADERIQLHLSPGQDHLRITLSLDDQVADTRTEFVAELSEPPDPDAVHLVLDFLDGVLAEHLQSDREALPRLAPAPCSFEGKTIALSGQRRRPGLEAQADALLASAGSTYEEGS